MPTYDFLNKETGEVVEMRLSVADREQFLKENPQFEPYIERAPDLGDSVRLGIRRTDDGFREVLSKIARNNYKSNLGDKLSRK